MTTPNKTKEEVLAEIVKNKEATLSRHQNFDALKEGITEKFVLNSLNLKDRQQESAEVSVRQISSISGTSVSLRGIGISAASDTARIAQTRRSIPSR